MAEKTIDSDTFQGIMNHAFKVIAVLVKRSGGKVEITKEEFDKSPEVVESILENKVIFELKK